MTADWANALRADWVNTAVPAPRTHAFAGQKRLNDWTARQAKSSSLSYLVRETGGNSEDPEHSALPGSILRDAIRYIHSNLDSRLTWKDLASAVGVDEFKFGRSFKLSTGMTPHQYVTRCRLRRALNLLERGEMAIADIALEVGCSCQSHLTTLLRKYTGTTPAAFRRAVNKSNRLTESNDHHLPLVDRFVQRDLPDLESVPDATCPAG